MPFQYSGSGRTRKPKKDGEKRPSISSVVSQVSHSTKESPKASKKESKAQPEKASTAPNQKQPRKSTEPEKRAPDVFEFLDEDDSNSSSSDYDDSMDLLSSQATSTSKGQSKTQSIPGRFPSAPNYLDNSRTSQKGSVPSRRSSVMSKDSMDSRLPPLPFDTSSVMAQLQLTKPKNRKLAMEESYVPSGSSSGGSTLSGDQELDFSPEAYYSRPRNAVSMHRPPLPPSPPKSPEGDVLRDHRKPKKNVKSSQVPSGYGLVASRLSSETDEAIPPLYRRFENLNHRVLLHLQDEIAQMEEDLNVLDEYEEMHRIATAEHEGSKVLPASRRMDAQAQVYSSLHFRRLELLGTLVYKTEQYNNALSAYNKVLQSLPPASSKDIGTYRTWLDAKHPIATAETRFLDHNKDLVSLAPPTRPSSSTPIYSAIIIASAAILFPLLAFSMIHEFAGRLVLVTVVGGAAAAIAASYSTGVEQLVDSRDGWRCATVYFGFMTVAALFIP